MARCKLKDLASAPALERAIAAEIRRQAALLDRGVAVTSLTLAHDAAEDRPRVIFYRPDVYMLNSPAFT